MRTQRPSEQLIEYARALRVLADKTYPSWSIEQWQEVLKARDSVVICGGRTEETAQGGAQFRG